MHVGILASSVSLFLSVSPFSKLLLLLVLLWHDLVEREYSSGETDTAEVFSSNFLRINIQFPIISIFKRKIMFLVCNQIHMHILFMQCCVCG